MLKWPFKPASRSRTAVSSQEAADHLIAEGNRAEKEGKLREACELYRKAVDAAPGYAKAHLNLGIGLEAIGDIEGAMTSHETALARDPGDPYANYNLANLLYARGELGRAEKLLRAALERKPDFPEAHVVLSNVYESQKNFTAAAAALDIALKQKPTYVGAWYNYGVVMWKLGQLTEAETALRRATELDPGFVPGPGSIDTWHLLGIIAYQRGQHDQATRHISESLRRQASNPRAHNDLGMALAAQGRQEEAEACFRKAIALEPDYLDAHTNLGSVLGKQGKQDEADACYRRALAVAPESSTIYYKWGNLLVEQGRLAEAIAAYRKALELKPDLPEAHANLGSALRDQGALDESIGYFRRALEIRPNFPGVHFNLGNTLLELGRTDEAIGCYREAIRLKADFLEAHYNLGIALRDQDRHNEAMSCLDTVLGLTPDSAETYYCVGQVHRDAGHRDEALECFHKALSLNPEHVEARWSLAMQQVPVIYPADADPAQFKTAFSLELDKLDRWFDAKRAEHGFRVVGTQQPFLLAYQEVNNRDLLVRYGKLCTRLMAEWFRRQTLGAPLERGSTGVIRIGIVSQFFLNHSVWNAIVKGWFQQLDRGRLALDAFYLGSRQDQETQFAMSHASHFECGMRRLRQWVEAIALRQPDVLVYPEIGMDPMTLRLASLRLAPVQVATWGHPETTGLPTIDYYLSAEDLEPPGAQSNYTERLIALPHLGCYYAPREVTPVNPDQGSWGIAPDTALLLCAGTPFKYAPQHDWIFPEIARRLGQCRFVFFLHRTNPSLSEILRKRLDLAFSRKRLDMRDFVTFLPWQAGPEFYGLLKRSRVFLDTIGFSGFNTAMQAVECGLPIVTREGRFLRGRLASGILKRMGLSELVAQSEEDYVALAVRLVQDAEYREHLRERIEASRHLLFEDIAPIRALEVFLATVARRR